MLTGTAPTARQISEAYEQCELTPTEVVQRYLDQITAHNATIGAYVTVDAEGAMASAELATTRLRRGERRSPLDGVPICVKDLTCTNGLRTTFSSRAFSHYEPDFDDPIVARIRDAGLIILGKTNTPEFGALAVTQSELNGVCRNPWDLSLTAAGSSGGSAAAVAAAMAPFAHGSDGAGSVRLPAACCGLVGVKPGTGLPQRSGARLGSPVGDMATDGFLARTFTDVAALCSVLLPEEMLKPPSKAPLRIGLLVRPPIPTAVDEICLAAVESVARLLAAAGHSVQPADLPFQSETMVDDMMVVRACIGADFGVEDEALLDSFLASMAAWRRELPATAVRQAQDRVTAFRDRLVAWSAAYDVVLMPSAATPAKRLSWLDEAGDCFAQFHAMAEWNAFAPLANLAMLPAVTVPLPGTGFPFSVGAQLVGSTVGLLRLLELGAELERTLSQPVGPALFRR